MNVEHIEIIRSRTAYLVGTIDPENDLKPLLFTNHVLTPEQIASCYSERTPDKINTKILDLLCRSPKASFKAFLTCLEKIGRSDLSDQLHTAAAQIHVSKMANHSTRSVNGATGVTMFFSVLSAVLAVVRGCQIAGCNGSTATQSSLVSQLCNTAASAPQVNTCCPPSDASRLTPEMENAQPSDPVQRIGVKRSSDSFCDKISQYDNCARVSDCNKSLRRMKRMKDWCDQQQKKPSYAEWSIKCDEEYCNSPAKKCSKHKIKALCLQYMDVLQLAWLESSAYLRKKRVFDEYISGVTFYNGITSRKQKVISSSGQLHFIEQSNNSDASEFLGFCKRADDIFLETILKRTTIEDVASSKIQNCMYSFDSNNNCVLKISDGTMGKTVEVFIKFHAEQMHQFCKTISTTDDGEVLLLRNDPPLLCVFDSQGELQHTISLDKNMKQLQHVKKCPKTGHYIISHGSTDESLHRVCKVTREGIIIGSYGGKRGIGEGHLNCPAHLAVDECGNIFVADKLNNLVLLLDSDLDVAVPVLSEDMDGIHNPHRLCYDTDCGRLLVGYGKCVLELVLRPLR